MPVVLIPICEELLYTNFTSNLISSSTGNVTIASTS